MPAIGSFLQRSRHGTTYFFRRRVPDDLCEIIGRRQIYRSLRTTHASTALVRARALATQTDRFFAQLRAMPHKKNEEGFRTRLIFEADFDLESGLPTSIKLKTDPDNPADQLAGERILKAALTGVREDTGSGMGADRATPQALPSGPSKVLSVAVDEFLREAASLKGSTRAAYRTALHRVAVPFFGAGKPLAAISQQNFAEFAQHVDKMNRAHGTKELYLVALCSMGEWQRNRTDNVPTWNRRTLLTTDATPANRKRDELTMEQLAVIFRSAARYIEREPAKFWVTVLPAFFGCRLEELAQVDLRSDLGFDEPAGVHYLRLDELEFEEDGPNERPTAVVQTRSKSIKTKAGWRVLPIHSALVAAGAVRFLQAQLAAGYERPFQAQWNPLRLSHFDKGQPVETVKWSHQISKWGQRQFKALVKAGLIKRRGKEAYFHSMRHTFITNLARRHLGEEERALLTGHAHGGINNEVYTKLRNDAKHLSTLVEQHLDEYVLVLNAALAEPLVLKKSDCRKGKTTQGTPK